jgi:hypothetical protein
MGEVRNAQIILVRRPEGKRPLRRPRCRCKDNSTVDKEIQCEDVD